MLADTFRIEGGKKVFGIVAAQFHPRETVLMGKGKVFLEGFWAGIEA